MIARLRSFIRFFSVKYTKEHEWIHYDESTKTGTFGITEFAQSQLGDIVHLHLPSINSKYKQGETIGKVESVTFADDIYMPVSGTVLEVNNLLNTHPEVVNQSAECNGWVAKIKVENPDELDQLLDEQGYKKLDEVREFY